jgi:hypothetical protein
MLMTSIPDNRLTLEGSAGEEFLIEDAAWSD